MNTLRRFSLVAILACACMAGVARADDGCADESNDRITAELALCNVHAYNIGISENPTGADKQLMKEIVALKTTIITQQMNKQYEYMDAMIRRFKTQLEKAMLTTKLQAAGAAPASSGSRASSSSGGRASNGLANAEDCLGTSSSPVDAFQCLQRNLSKIQSAVSSGDLGAARKQLTIDMNTLESYSSIGDNAACKDAYDDNGACKKASTNGSKAAAITTCIGKFRACIVLNIDARNNSKNNQQQYNR